MIFSDQWFTLVLLFSCIRLIPGWMNPFADQGIMAGGGMTFSDPLSQVGLAGDFGAFGGMAAAGSNMAPSLMPMNGYRSGSSSIGSICYCDIRVNKLGQPGDLLLKLHYPTINAQTCQAAIQQCSSACSNQARRQLTGPVVDFEQGGLENASPDKDVSVGSVLCKEHNKIISPPGVVASVFAKPDACGRAIPLFDLTGEESRLCCTLIAHPYIRTEHILVFSPECIAGVAPPAAKADPAAAGAATTAAPNPNSPPAGAAPSNHPGMGSPGMGNPGMGNPGMGNAGMGNPGMNMNMNNMGMNGPPQVPEAVPFNQMPYRPYPDPSMMMNPFG